MERFCLVSCFSEAILTENFSDRDIRLQVDVVTTLKYFIMKKMESGLKFKF